MTDYIKLTKPTIMILVLFTGAAALVVEGSMLGQPGRFLLFMLGLYLTGGCANALNQYFERELDAVMTRTAARRPLPQKKLRPFQALTFSIGIGLAGLAILAFYFNWLTALLSLATILFYGLFYTLVLKPGTPQNIVIGGAAGAMAPVGAWAAATGTTAWIPWLMFAIIFLWTPPHFWSLAIAYKDDYRSARLPMMPIVRGDRATLRQMMAYSLALVGLTVALGIIVSGWIFLAVAILLGGILVAKCFRAARSRDIAAIKSLFVFSILYLFGLFGSIMLEALMKT
jgi:protoheme IX farnesyltransferase